MKFLSDPQVQTVILYTAIVILGFLPVVATKIKESKKIPASWQKWIDKITPERIKGWMTQAESMTNMTGAQRRDFVIGEMKAFALDQLDDHIPHAIATMIVELIYQKMKGRLLSV